jgi:8-oxo-dGTP pyrophosphatase MutT (NUDIX family)
MYPVRNSIKALIVENMKLLCIEKKDNEGKYYILPGGGQEKNETFIETLIRECKEEIGARVHVKRLRYIREYIGKNHEFAKTDDMHQVEFMFECELIDIPDIEKAHQKDEGQEDIKWVELNGNDRVYPKCLKERLLAKYEGMYWGDIN